MSKQEIIDELREVQQRIKDKKIEVDEWVIICRRYGVPWSEIGKRTGMSRQGASQKWGKIASG